MEAAVQIGPASNFRLHHRLLIPSAGVPDRRWTLDHLQQVAALATADKIPVLQFHGIPDPVHPWVDFDPETFEAFLRFLKAEGFRAIAVRELEAYLPARDPADPLLLRLWPSEP